MKHLTLTLPLVGLLTTTSVSNAELTLSSNRSEWANSVEATTTEPILTQSFDGADTTDTDLPVATETFDIFGNFSVYLETLGNVPDTFFDYAFDSTINHPLDLGVDISGSDTTTALEFRFASPQIGFAADFFSVDEGEGLTITLFNGTTPTGESVNIDAILAATEGDGFIGFTTDLPFTSFAFSPLSETAMIFNLDEVSTVAAGGGVVEPSSTAPIISSTSLSSGKFFFTTRSSDIGQSYQIQSSADHALGQWTNIGDIVNGTGGPLNFEVVTPPSDIKNFYRIKVILP